MNNVRITDSVIYLVWAWQGIIIDDVAIEDETTINIHLSIPSNTFVKDTSGKTFSYFELLPRVQTMARSLAFAMKANQGITTKFTFDKRDEDWTIEEGKQAVQEMTWKIAFNAPPFEGVF